MSRLFLAVMLLGTSFAQLHAQTPNDVLKLSRRAQQPLQVGSQAPQWDISDWIESTSGATPKPITQFQPGTVYVMEFWATWCPGCVASMPHLANLKQEFAGQKVEVLAVSNEQPDAVRELLARSAPATLTQQLKGRQATTYGDIMSAFHVATDADESVQVDYMEAAGENGIPTVFVIGKQGKVEWWGSPLEADEVVRQVTADRWDRSAFALIKRKGKEFEQITQEVLLQVRRQQFEGAFETLDKAIAAETESEPQREKLKHFKLRVLLVTRDSRSVDFAKAMMADATNPSFLNGFAWMIYQLETQQQVDPELIQLAYESANKGLELTKEQDEVASLLDTLGHLHHAQGQLKKAISIQQRAVAQASPAIADPLRSFLKKMQVEQIEAEKSPAKEVPQDSP